MKKHRSFQYALLFSLLLGGTSATVTASEHPQEKSTNTRQFEQRKTHLNKQVLSVFKKNLSSEERRLLEFLYTYMPLPDLVDYSGDFYRKNVECALQAREEMPWGKTIPRREWLHFVLPVRVNNENLDESRLVFYQALKERVKNKSMYEAALEVNHWCHEKVTYQPSDARTSAPLASVKTAFGRCGEESTFTVAALRSVGIPARQVYTPRWAHTDDNHAWVEVWIDGKWHFLGACEPEAVLDLGWFNAPASRGMLMHTKVFGHYDGPEEVMSQTKCYTEINVTQNYAEVGNIDVTVRDEQGKPLSGIPVAFRLYNYGEFYPVARKNTDANGHTFLTAGLGDMVVWAAHNGKFDFQKCSFGKDKTLTLTLNKEAKDLSAIEMDITPPAGRNNLPNVTEEQQTLNKKRLAKEDSIRNAYVSTFQPEKRVQELYGTGFSTEGSEYTRNDVLDLVTAARGNYATLISFLTKHKGTQTIAALDLLRTLRPKDLRDVSQEVLEDHFSHTLSTPRDQQSHLYLRSPRIANEMLTPYRSFFLNAFSKKERSTFRETPEKWLEWCKKNLVIDNSWNPQGLCMSPQGVYNNKVTDARSRNIFFVAGLRSFGTPARINEVTGDVQYLKGEEWMNAEFTRNKKSEKAETGKLQLTYSPISHLQDPVYYTHFTLSRINDGQPTLQEYGENSPWSQLFKEPQEITTGDYMLTTGTRMADGSVLTRLTFFNVSAQENKKIPLVIRDNTEGIKVIGSFNSESNYFDADAKEQKSILSTTGRGYYIIGIVRSGEEPTNHALRDMALRKEQLEKWNRPILLLFESQEDLDRYRNSVLAHELKLPSTIHWGVDLNHTIANQIIDGMKLSARQSRPIFLVADTFNRVVFEIQGYTIGLGEQLTKVTNQLKQ